MKLGKIIELDIRSVWAHEQYDFSKWLAEEENIRALGETLNLSLTDVNTEQFVGNYRCDIICKDELTGKSVLIENQLEQTNHDHLGKIITYREADHDLLMSIRNGDYLDENDQPINSFYELVNDLETDLEYWKEHTHLPDEPDMQRINSLHRAINEMVCNGAPLCVGSEPTFTEWRSAFSGIQG